MDGELESRLQELNVDAICEIKELLRKRCTDTQMSAVAVLQSCLEKESLSTRCPLREFMLDEDMVGIISDAMTTNSWPLLERLTSVLELLSDSNKMVQDGHAVLAVEAAQRRAHFLGLMISTSADCMTALRAVLGLLTTLLHRWTSLVPRRKQSEDQNVSVGEVRPMTRLCSPLGLLSTLRLVLNAGDRASGTSEAATTMSAVTTLSCLLDLVAVGAESGDHANLAAALAACVRAALNALQKLLHHHEHPGDKKDKQEEDEDQRLASERACQHICIIAARITSVRAMAETLLGADENDDVLLSLEDVEAEARQLMLDKCLPMVVYAARTCIEDSMEQIDAWGWYNGCSSGQPAMTGELIHSLETSLMLSKDPFTLADTLACQDFLWLLPTLHRTEPGSTVSLRVLCAMLHHLAYELLDAGSWWSGSSGMTLSAFLESAAPLLDVDNRTWPGVLHQWRYLTTAGPSAGPASAAQLLVLLLTYFRALAGSECDQEELLALASNLPAYVVSLPYKPTEQTRTPTSVLKIVWLSFAVYCVLTTDKMSSECRTANGCLVQMMDEMLLSAEDSKSLRLAYTHHPALLYWAFQAPGVSPRLQQRLLELWLGSPGVEEDPNSTNTVTGAPVMEIVLAQPQAVLPLLDVVVYGEIKAADHAVLILHAAAAGPSASHSAVARDLSAGLWDRLPLELSRYTSRAPSRDPGGCGRLVWLAAELYRPPPPDAALRLASLLAKIMGLKRFGPSPKYVTAAMLIVRRLLDDAKARSDPRVLTMFLCDTRFSEVVLSAATWRDSQVCSMAMNLLRHIEEDNTLLKSPATFSPMTLKVATLLNAVHSKDPEVLEAGLLLLLEVVKTKANPFIVLEENVAYMRTTYFMLQNQAIKFQERPLGDVIWTALKEFMPKSGMLIHSPWNHVLISFTVKQTPLTKLCKEFFSFVLEWLRLLAPPEPPRPTPRRPMPTMVTETAIEIATALVNSGQRFQNLTIVQDLSKAILGVTADLPPSLELAIKCLAGLQ